MKWNGKGKGKGRWKEDSLRKVGRMHDTQVILYSVQCYVYGDPMLCIALDRQKLSKPDNWFSSYSRKCCGCFLRHSVQLI